MFGISGFELLLIAVFVLIIFGPDKLPDLARTFGKAMRQFKNAQEEMERVIKAEIYRPNAANDLEPGEQTVDPTTASHNASAVWSATDEDDEEEDEE